MYTDAAGTARNRSPAQEISQSCFLTALLAALCVLPVVIAMKLRLSPPLLVLDMLIVCIAATGVLRGNSSGFERVPVYIAFFAGFAFMIYLNLDVQHDSRKDNYEKKIARG
jgi:hypothetical protein